MNLDSQNKAEGTFGPPAPLGRSGSHSSISPRPVAAVSPTADDSGDFRDPSRSEVDRLVDEACNDVLPERIGRYRILSLLGTGGMGVVYRAEQDHPRRDVALKTLRLGLADRRMMARFENEVASLARLRHPNIAQIYDAGVVPAAWGRQPYIAMELIDGPRLIDYIQQRKLKTPERLRLFVELCDAVEHAHQRGVIHRDLKPANILVAGEGLGFAPQPVLPALTSAGPRTLSTYVPRAKILDFGVARLRHRDASQTLATAAGEILGTLAYMSPEQVSGSPDAVDTRSDVYALGCVLYELLTGRPPIDLRDLPVTRASERILNDRPPPLRQYDASLRGDLEIIVAKTLEKDPERRYPSAAALGDDIRHFLACEPIAARKPSAAYVAGKWIARHRAACALGALVVVSLALGATGMVGGMLRSERARHTRHQLLHALTNGVNGIATEILPELASIAGTADMRRALLAKLLPLRDLLMSFEGDEPRFLAAQADVLDAIAGLEEERDDLDARFRNRTAVFDARRRLVAVTPDDRRQILRFAIDHVRIGDIVKERRDVQAADDWYSRAFALQHGLMQAEPDCIDAQIALTWSHFRLADTANRLGRPQDMVTRLEAAESLLNHLLIVTGGAEEIRLLDCRQQCLAIWTDFYSAREQRDDAYRMQRERVDCLRRLSALSPANRTHAIRTVSAMVNLACNDVRPRGDCDSARQGLAEAEPRIEKLARLEPDNVEVGDLRIVAVHLRARIELSEGHPDVALDHALRARSLLEGRFDCVLSSLTATLFADNSALVEEASAACGFGELGATIRHENDERVADLTRQATFDSPAGGPNR